MESLLAPIVRRTLDWLQNSLSWASQKHNFELVEISAILLSGGSTRVPLVRKMLAAHFPNTQIRYDESSRAPHEVVAVGACILADRLPDQEPFVFVSAKSEDYKYAANVYEFLKSRGVPTFFSPESLPQLKDSDYRKQIDDALDKVRHLVVVTSSRKNVTSEWVEAEWGLFINEKRSGLKRGNIITIVAGDMTPAQLPPSLRYYEVFPLCEEGLQQALKFLA
jgi:hypothetical protein